ncbi:MAG: hypothetical protein O3B01_20445 [Planctomycetota bacterium]|nr:hypothetical protein [Planctomycetota bacterium]
MKIGQLQKDKNQELTNQPAISADPVIKAHTLRFTFYVLRLTPAS